jgi:glycerol-3-phosphate acyltransferase PlsY
MTNYILIILAAYLLGSVPFGFIIAAAHGKDLRKIGSGNIGATNLARAVGRGWAFACFGLDVLKGLLPMIAAGLFLPGRPSAARFGLWLAVGSAAICGHVFSVYLGFRGGKGVATSFGVALGLWPYYTLCAVAAIAVWAVVVLVWRYVSLASIAAAAAFPVVLAAAVILVPSWEAGRLWPLLMAAAVLPAVVIGRHRDNIKRLLSGTEGRIFRRQGAASRGM